MPRPFRLMTHVKALQDPHLILMSLTAILETLTILRIAVSSCITIRCISAGLAPQDMLTSKLLPCDAGLSNTITALTGAGLTGSYIFSQTIFSMRAGVHTRLHGAIIAGESPPPASTPCSPVPISPCATCCQP